MILGKWESVRPLFVADGVPTFAGISGGRTSGMMAALCDESVTLCFENTGREHPATYEFLREIEGALGRKIHWLEFRPPAVFAAPPREFTFAEVSYETADRTGKPFREFLRCLADYRREHKGQGPISPWARGRICTAYMKHKVLRAFIESLLGRDAEYDELVGLRADEPQRVARLRERATQRVDWRAPLAEAGITVEDVAAFWAVQSFDLRCAPHQGNCTACFLKDQSDLARVLQEPETDAEWWEAIERDYPNFGGRSFPGYAQLRREGPGRQAIESDLRAGRTPLPLAGWDLRRWRNVVKQEEKRLRDGPDGFSCGCEGAVRLAEEVEL